MELNLKQRIIFILHTAYSICGWQAVAAFFLILISCFFALQEIPDLTQSIRATENQIALKSLPPPQIIPVHSADPIIYITTSLANLPREGDVGKALKLVFQLVENEGLSLQRGTYELSSASHGVKELRITLPLKGDYFHIKSYIAHLVETVPTSAVNTLRIHRNRAEDGNVDADLGITLYFKAE